MLVLTLLLKLQPPLVRLDFVLVVTFPQLAVELEILVVRFDGVWPDGVLSNNWHSLVCPASSRFEIVLGTRDHGANGSACPSPLCVWA